MGSKRTKVMAMKEVEEVARQELGDFWAQCVDDVDVKGGFCEIERSTIRAIRGPPCRIDQYICGAPQLNLKHRVMHSCI